MSKGRTIFYDYNANVDIALPSREALQKSLGDMDVMAEYTICAVRSMKHNSAKSKLTHRMYVEKKAIKHQVNMRGCDYNANIERDLCKTFMLNSYAMLDVFVHQYRTDIQQLLAPSFCLLNDDKKSNVDKLLIALKGAGIVPECKEWILQCLNYYRYVRNGSAHNPSFIEKSKTVFQAINREELWDEYPVFARKAPNAPDRICVDDLYFYSACIKHFANYLVMALKGKVDWKRATTFHPKFQRENIPAGVNPRVWVNQVLNEYRYSASDDEKNFIVEYIIENKQTKK